MHRTIQHIKRRFVNREVPIAPLITFRILFGALMMVGALRFMWSGWIERLYGEPVFFFKYYGFEWVQVFDVPGMYLLYGIVALSAGLVMLGLFYRAAIITFFLSFTYAELTDLTNYLNHYYLVCLLAFLLIFLPAQRRFSLDVWRKPKQRLDQVPVWTINMLILQLSIVYFFAGFAKLNPDWLFRAMPLAVWLPAKADLPLIGSLLTLSWMPFAFSWAGALYDLTIPFWLMNRRTRPFAYAAVVVFHVLTRILFNIGLFPFIMIFNTLIFFPASFHEKLLSRIGYRRRGEPEMGIREEGSVFTDAGLSGIFSRKTIASYKQNPTLQIKGPFDLSEVDASIAPLFCKQSTAPKPEPQWPIRPSERSKVCRNPVSAFATSEISNVYLYSASLLGVVESLLRSSRQILSVPSFYKLKGHCLATLLGVYFLIQLLLPLRYLLYPGNVLWTEEGYRFAWRVMLVEKAGQATFTVEDPATGRRSEVINSDYLTTFQEKQMVIQPDFILQYAHFLAEEYREKYGIENPVVTVDCHVALNGRASRRLIDPDVNLAACRDGLAPKHWILRD